MGKREERQVYSAYEGRVYPISSNVRKRRGGEKSCEGIFEQGLARAEVGSRMQNANAMDCKNAERNAEQVQLRASGEVVKARRVG